MRNGIVGICVLDAKVFARDLVDTGDGYKNVHTQQVVVDRRDLGRVSAPDKSGERESHVLWSRNLMTTS